MSKIAIILVDVQNDFIDGSLSIDFAESIIEPINKLISSDHFVVASLDVHPSNHISFVENGGIWPPHCIEGTRGVKLHDKLDKKKIDLYIYKGTNFNVEAYSAFDGEDKSSRKMDDIFKEKGITDLIIAGLALDYCVFDTIKHALDFGYKVKVYKNTVEAVKDKILQLDKLVKMGVEVI